jgi:MFS family permease
MTDEVPPADATGVPITGDRPTTGAATTADSASTSPAADERPSTLLGQLGHTKDSFRRLVNAHIDLLKAEINEILAQIAVIAGLGFAALVFAFITLTMLYVGGFLFLGEWLFGSIGWGFAHGLLFGIVIMTNIVFVILGASGMRLAAAFIVALVVLFAVAVLCGSNAGYNAANGVASGLAQPLGTPGVVALLAGIVFGAILFALLLARVAGTKGAIGGLFLGAILGALLGWLIAGAPWTWQPAFGFGITVALVAWIILIIVFAVPGLDPAAKFSKLYPRQSVESFDETRAFLEEQWRSRQPKLGKK